MIELIPILIGILLAATVAASTGYYRQIRKAQKEYEKAKGAVEDIVLSFNRELKRESERLELIAYKVEGSLAKSGTGLKKIDNIEKKILPFENQISAITQITQNNSSLSTALSGLDVKIKDIETTQENLKLKISGFEDQIQKISSMPPEFRNEPSMPVIPIKRDKAMAALTTTEIAVLEMLVSEGSKTAPEIKDRVQLSREHTARLMKKLYEGGYLEREVGKIPFRYTVKKEMEKLLRKTEANPQT
jgi:chromosome segregation ATPase